MAVAKRHPALVAGLPVIILLGFCNIEVSAEPHYTPGDNVGDDWHSFVYAPFFWQYTYGIMAYFDHVHVNTEATTGQRYPEVYDFMEFDKPNPGPWYCKLDDFEEILSWSLDSLGTLLILTHGDPHMLVVEVYDDSPEGWDARDLAYDQYLAQGYAPTQVVTAETDDDYPCIGVTDSYLRAYGDLGGALVFVGACYSSSIIDDLVDEGGARVAMGITGENYAHIIGDMVETLFYRMDGKFGQQYRPVSYAKLGIPDFVVYGEENTVLTVAVQNVNHPTPIKLGDTITITFDTKCNTYANPDIWCDWGYVNPGEWMADSLTYKAVFAELPPSWIDEIEVTLGWDRVWSARNWACLDGNTDPWGSNAEGPAHDDYVWTMAVAPCDCTLWGDVDGNDYINPVDVVFMVNYVYHSNDMRVQHAT